MDITGIDESNIQWPRLSPQCTFCRHYDYPANRECLAFPERIPEEIWRADFDHSAPYPGDHGIRFEAIANA